MPPLVGVAVKLTDVPVQTGLAEAETDTLTGSFGRTDTGYWLLDAGLFVVHVREDVNVQETMSPIAGT